MTPRALMVWIGLALSLPLAGAACSRSPEDFCAAWVEETCEALSSCCRDGREFDRAACWSKYSSTCHRLTQSDDVRAGDVLFDSGEAGACLDALATCTNITLSLPSDAEHAQACANMVTGFRPLGAACDTTSQCERAGEYATCYHGHSLVEGGPGGNEGFCAEVVSDDERCGFSFDGNVLRVCSDDRYCDVLDADLLESTSVLERSYYFSAPCRPRLAEGKSCVDTRNDSDILPCKNGLFCKVTGPFEATCVKVKARGEPCEASLDVCDEGLECLHEPNVGGFVCRKPKPPIPFFCAPPCGDGKCSDGETPESCPKDCAGSN